MDEGESSSSSLLSDNLKKTQSSKLLKGSRRAGDINRESLSTRMSAKFKSINGDEKLASISTKGLGFKR